MGAQAKPSLLVVVCGSRTFSDAAVVCERLAALPGGSEVVHGDARGADRLADEAALGLLVDGHVSAVTKCPANWHIHGKRAGIVRNLHMLGKEPDLVIAFWDGESRGTKHTIDEARRRGIPVEIVRAEREPASANQKANP